MGNLGKGIRKHVYLLFQHEVLLFGGLFFVGFGVHLFGIGIFIYFTVY